MRIFLSCLLLIALIAVDASTSGAQTRLPTGIWKVVHSENVAPGGKRIKTTRAFGEPNRSSPRVCRTKAIEIDGDWKGGSVPSDSDVVPYFAIAQKDCAELDVAEYKVLLNPIEDQTLARLIQSIPALVSKLDGEGLRTFENHFGAEASPKDVLKYKLLWAVGVSESGYERSNYELYFSLGDGALVVLAKSDGAAFQYAGSFEEFD